MNSYFHNSPVYAQDPEDGGSDSDSDVDGPSADGYSSSKWCTVSTSVDGVIPLMSSSRLATPAAKVLFDAGQSCPLAILAELDRTETGASTPSMSHLSDYAWIVKNLRPGAVYVFQLASVTVSGVGLFSRSKPVQTEGME